MQKWIFFADRIRKLHKTETKSLSCVTSANIQAPIDFGGYKYSLTQPQDSMPVIFELLFYNLFQNLPPLYLEININLFSILAQ